jgi:membrane protein implicated in regulation of membrane protease activity
VEYKVYLYSAIVGCTLVVIQVVLQIIGFGGDADIDHADADLHGGDVDTDGHGNLFFGILSFKAVCAFAGLFGLTGLTAMQSGLGAATRVGVSFGAGLAGMFLVAWIMRSLSRLQASGTVNLGNAVGRTGTVYLRVPERGTGQGKVTIEIQGRSMEFAAITDGETLATGTRVTVMSIDGNDVLRVANHAGETR